MYETGRYEIGSNEIKAARAGKSFSKVIIAAFVILFLSLILLYCKMTKTEIFDIGSLFAKNEKFEPGTINGNVYVNDYIGIKLTLPSSYTIPLEAEKQQSIGKSSELSQSDLYAYDPTTGTSIMILCKKYDKKDNPIPLVENEFSDQLKELLKATETTSWTFSDNSKTTLVGKDYTYFTGSAVLPSSKTGIAQKNFIRKINEQINPPAMLGRIE